jgi:HlyD family secretion protein
MRRIGVVFVLLAVALGTALWWKIRQQEAGLSRPPGSSGWVEGTRVAVAARISARIAKMNVEEGAVVKAGDVLAELDCTEMDAVVAEAEARVEAGRVQVDLARAQADAAAIQAKAAARQAAGQQAQVGSYRVQGENARRQSDRAGRLKGESVMAEAQWESADTATKDLANRMAAAGAAAEAARLSAQAADRQARAAPDQVRAAGMQVEAGEAAVARAKVAQAECRVTAPRAGVVTLKAREPGEVVLPGTTLYELTDDSEAKVTFYVANADLGRVATGMAVEVEADAWQGVVFAGAITRVGREAEFTPRTIQTRTDRERLVYEVEARVDNREGRLRPGMPVEVRVK